jgi:hypothetical protein
MASQGKRWFFIGQEVDVISLDVFNAAIVIDVFKDCKSIRVHYIGWEDASYDETITDLNNVYPAYSFVQKVKVWATFTDKIQSWPSIAYIRIPVKDSEPGIRDLKLESRVFVVPVGCETEEFLRPIACGKWIETSYLDSFYKRRPNRATLPTTLYEALDKATKLLEESNDAFILTDDFRFQGSYEPNIVDAVYHPGRLLLISTRNEIKKNKTDRLNRKRNASTLGTLSSTTKQQQQQQQINEISNKKSKRKLSELASLKTYRRGSESFMIHVKRPCINQVKLCFEQEENSSSNNAASNHRITTLNSHHFSIKELVAGFFETEKQVVAADNNNNNNNNNNNQGSKAADDSIHSERDDDQHDDQHGNNNNQNDEIQEQQKVFRTVMVKNIRSHFPITEKMNGITWGIFNSFPHS